MPSGFSVGALAPRAKPPTDVQRGQIKGMSAQSAARHTTFLQSVDPGRLTGFGYALTLTVRKAPPSPRDWAGLRKRLQRHLKYRNAVRVHWVVEKAQQKRGGVPHLHLGVYFDHELSPVELWQLKDAWCRIAEAHGAKHQGQDAKRIRPGDVGWAKYCGKHGSRTARHQQREGIPAEGWDSSGRMWGRWGDWPTRLDRWLLNGAAVVELKRLLRSWLVSDAAVSGRKLCAFKEGRRLDWSRPVPKGYRRGVAAARRVLRSDPDLGALRGMRGWGSEVVTLELMRWVAARPGCVVAEILDDRGGSGWWRRLMVRRPGEPLRDYGRWRLGLPEPAHPMRSAYTVRPIGPDPGPPVGPLTERQARIEELRSRHGWEH